MSSICRATRCAIVDIGDADIVHTDTMGSLANAEIAVRKILRAGALPVSLGGDHSVHAACIEAFARQPPVHIVHFDAHLDFVDERHGVRYGHGNPLRRASEMAHVTGMTQLGIRSVSSSNKIGLRRGARLRLEDPLGPADPQAGRGRGAGP